jgi:quinol monooxygenase YgiN
MVEMTLTMLVHPGRRVEVVKALRSLMRALQSARGLLACRVYVESDNPNSICYMEKWNSAEEMDEQIRSIHYTRLLSIIEAAAEPPDIQLSWVSQVRGLEYLRSVRLRDDGLQQPVN